MTLTIITPVLLAVTLTVVSCAHPKAVPSELAPAPVKQNVTASQVVPNKVAVAPVPVPSVPLPVDDGIRIPDMFAMPTDDEFRATNPAPGGGSETNAIILRPPTDPPSRVKPTGGE